MRLTGTAHAAACWETYLPHVARQVQPLSNLTQVRAPASSRLGGPGLRQDERWHKLLWTGSASAAAALLLFMPADAAAFGAVNQLLPAVEGHHARAYHTASADFAMCQLPCISAAPAADSHTRQQQQKQLVPQQYSEAPANHQNSHDVIAPLAAAPTHQQDVAVALISSESIWYPLALSAVAGLSTSIGGLLAVSVAPGEATLAFLLGTAIGVMATVSLVELWAHPALETQDPAGVTAAVAAGAALFALLDNLLPSEAEAGIQKQQRQEQQQDKDYIKAAHHAYHKSLITMVDANSSCSGSTGQIRNSDSSSDNTNSSSTGASVERNQATVSDHTHIFAPMTPVSHSQRSQHRHQQPQLDSSKPAQITEYHHQQPQQEEVLEPVDPAVLVQQFAADQLLPLLPTQQLQQQHHHQHQQQQQQQAQNESAVQDSAVTNQQSAAECLSALSPTQQEPSAVLGQQWVVEPLLPLLQTQQQQRRRQQQEVQNISATAQETAGQQNIAGLPAQHQQQHQQHGHSGTYKHEHREQATSQPPAGSSSSSNGPNWISTHPSELWRLGLLMAGTLTLHNLPEGFAVAFSAYTDVGPVMALAIALHNIPEGLVIAAPIYAATGNRWQAVGLATASGISEPVGAAAALLVAKPFVTSIQQLDYLLAATGGVMLAVCFLELWPEGRKCGHDAAMWRGAMLGAAVMAWTLYLGI